MLSNLALHLGGDGVGVFFRFLCVVDWFVSVGVFFGFVFVFLVIYIRSLVLD